MFSRLKGGMCDITCESGHAVLSGDYLILCDSALHSLGVAAPTNRGRSLLPDFSVSFDRSSFEVCWWVKRCNGLSPCSASEGAFVLLQLLDI